jgi:hypothetical protein
MLGALASSLRGGSLGGSCVKLPPVTFIWRGGDILAVRSNNSLGFNLRNGSPVKLGEINRRGIPEPFIFDGFTHHCTLTTGHTTLWCFWAYNEARFYHYQLRLDLHYTTT